MPGYAVEDVQAAAAGWVARMDGEWSDADERALEAWLALDSRHGGALLQAQAAWIALDDPIDSHGVSARAGGKISRRTMMVSGMTALTASVAGGLFWMQAATTYQTELGEIRRMPLADGSTATINSASELRIRLGRHQRDVRLASGEAWFRVAKDPSRPFVVQAGNVFARAVGTAFSVRIRATGIDVLVTEGIVEAWSAAAGEGRLRLTAGERAFIGNDASIRLAPASPSAVDRALAWRDGDIDLDGETLADAIDDFNRYNRRKLVIADPRLTAEKLDGTFRTDDPEGFARAVAESLKVPLDRSDPAAILIGKKTEQEAEGFS